MDAYGSRQMDFVAQRALIAQSSFVPLILFLEISIARVKYCICLASSHGFMSSGFSSSLSYMEKVPGFIPSTELFKTEDRRSSCVLCHVSNTFLSSSILKNNSASYEVNYKASNDLINYTRLQHIFRIVIIAIFLG